MGDSDDDYDRRRGRDKFRRERSDYNDRRRDRDDRPSRGREDWNDRRRDQNWDARRRDNYRDVDRPRRDNSGRHQEMSPPIKRIRKDWESTDQQQQQQYHGDFNMTPYSNIHQQQQAAAQWGQQHAAGTDLQTMQHLQEQKSRAAPDVEPTQGLPAMLTFKLFLQNMDDNIDDVEAVKKYQEYKLEFRKTRLADFFTAHKDEEWFKMKYHPKDSTERRRELLNAMKRRAAVFLEMLKSDSIDKATLDINNAGAIVKLLDAVVIKLEGGSDEDLAILDIPEPSRERSHSNSIGPEDALTQNGDEPITKPPTEDSKETVKTESILELAPVSPSSVPLPDAPPPLSAHIKKPHGTGKEADGSVNMTPEQQQLQQQAQFYQQMYLQQPPPVGFFPPGTEKPSTETPPAEAVKTPKDKEKEKGHKKDSDSKKKRKRRHREHYYYDDVEESESESESDSEPEPAPPGLETAAVASSQEEELLPPGVEKEAKPVEEPLPPGVEEPSSAAVPPPVSSVTPETEGEASETTDASSPVIEEAAKSEEPPKEETTPPVAAEAVTEKESKDVEMKDLDTTADPAPADSVQEKTTPKDTPAEELTGELIEENKTTEEEEKQSTEEPMETQATEIKSTPQEPQPQTEPQETQTQEPKSSDAEEKMETASTSTAVVADGETSKQPEDKEAKPVVASKPNEEKPATEEEKDATKDKAEEGQAETEEGEEKEGEEKNDKGKILGPRPLHKTYSLFMRNIPPKISRTDIIPICKRFPGFLRVSLSDPSPDRQFYRRGWISFDRTVNIKDICWNLSNIRVKDMELNPVVNRDLQRRVRPVAGFTVCKPVVKADIRLAARLIKALDTKAGLWGDNKEEKERLEKEKCKEEPEEGEEKDIKASEAEEEMIELPAENPVLSSLSEDVAEEEEGEEMELLGSASPERKAEDVQSGAEHKRDDNMIKVLDRLLLYLRIVHSMDYYNGSEYPYEDEMPNRCGIIHVRGILPENITQPEIAEWNKNLEQKLEPHLQEKEHLSDEEAAKLGKKDPEAEVEKFVQANTQEQAKDKWLCPLSGKKFRGPEFVRKHIFNKQMDKVDAVKMGAEFFNNYLYDPKRPQIPEIKPLTATSTPTSAPMGRGAGYSQGQYTPQGIQPIGSWNQQRTHMMMQHGGHRGYHTPQQYSNYGGHSDMYNRGGQTFPPKPRRNFNQRGRGGGSDRGSFHRDSRPLVQYRDLDAPDDSDLF